MKKVLKLFLYKFYEIKLKSYFQKYLMYIYIYIYICIYILGNCERKPIIPLSTATANNKLRK